MIEQPAGIHRFIRHIRLAVNRGSYRDQVIAPVYLRPMTGVEEQSHATLLLQAAGELADHLLHGALWQILAQRDRKTHTLQYFCYIPGIIDRIRQGAVSVSRIANHEGGARFGQRGFGQQQTEQHQHTQSKFTITEHFSPPVPSSVFPQRSISIRCCYSNFYFNRFALSGRKGNPWKRRRPRRLTNEQVEHKRRIAPPCSTLPPPCSILPEFVTVHAS